MTDKEKKSKIADILMDFQEEYSNEVINRPMLASLYAGNILSFIDSLQEEPASEDLEEASRNYADNEEYGDDVYFAIKVAFKAGAEWQKENIWKPADGNDLPEYDREVIAILDYDFGHYKVVYAHRPNHNGWNGTNIDTGEEEHFEPATYGKGGWNQPHILYWLDAKMPYEEK